MALIGIALSNRIEAMRIKELDRDTMLHDLRFLLSTGFLGFRRALRADRLHRAKVSAR
jgi:hypothetical protein